MSRPHRTVSAHLAHLWESLRTSYWFVPALMTAGSIGLSLLTVHLDQATGSSWVESAGWVWSGSPEGARQVLSTIAGSMITVAGVTFSITIVSLTLASSQFGPRLLRSFVRDLGNQVVLGTFISTFVYCLLVLRTVRGMDDAEFVPNLSVTLGVAFALSSLGVLIYFIHHISSAIQAEHLIAAVAGELRESIEGMFPEKLGEPGPEADDQPPAIDLSEEGNRIVAESSGYIQAVEEPALMDLSVKEDLVLELLKVPGDFVPAGGALARAWPVRRAGGEIEERIRGAFIIGRRRSPAQDPEYIAHQLVEIGVRALSPGINDPFTALTCLDWLGAALRLLAGRRIPSPYRYDEQRRLRVVVAGTDFPKMADASFNQIRQYGRSSVSVLLRLLDTIASVAPCTRRGEDRVCLRKHADKVIADARKTLDNQSDLREVEERYAAALHSLAAPLPEPVS